MFIILATATRVFGGADIFRSSQSSYLNDVAIDLFGGISGGVIVGLLRPMLISAKAAALAGFLALLPVAITVHLELSGFRGWGEDNAVGALLYALAIGAAVGALVWYRVQDRKSRNR